MPDISLCAGADTCPVKGTCTRNPDLYELGRLQSWFGPPAITDKGCSYFLPLKPAVSQQAVADLLVKAFDP